MHKILLIEDDLSFSTMLEKFLTRKAFVVEAVYSAQEAKVRMAENKYDLILTDLRLPDGDGLELVAEFKTQYPNIPILLMTGYSDVGTAVKAIKNGATDYISKPLIPEEVLLVIQNALQNSNITTKPILAKKSESQTFVVGISSQSKKLLEYINLVAPTDLSVLIIGESGTGKEIIAKSMHQKSNRKNQNFVAVDCGTIPKELAASEFFGHIKGSFTGAVTDKTGYFETANGGTLFLDEIGNLSYENQIQLLRALQERKIRPVGSNREIDVDIRIITATNEDLRDAVKNESFREDLYHRINEFSIQSPALRDRGPDLMLFAEFFLEKANLQLNREVTGFSLEVIAVFEKYNWPGNLRELQNVVKRAVLLTQGDFVEKLVLPHELFESTVTRSQFSLADNEREAILNALQKTGNNKSEAAKLLKMNRKTLYNKMNLHGLEY